MPWTTPETFTAGQTLTAASMNVISGDLSHLYTLARGQLAYSSKTTQAGPFVSVDNVGLDITFTAEAGRLYKVTMQVGAFTSGAEAHAQFYLREGATNLAIFGLGIPYTGRAYSATFTYFGTATAGSHQYRVGLARSAGTGTLNFYAAASEPAFVAIEDIGAA